MSPTLGIVEAAAFLRCHPDTLQRRAAAGIIPGAKVGRRWVFLATDLESYLRSLYACHSTDANREASGTSTSAVDAAEELDARLGRPIARSRSASMTRSPRASGNKGSMVVRFPTRS